MRFTKMHGIGNDYVYVNGFVEKVADPVQTAKKIADRHFGVGGDGLILILPSQKADVRMRMFNADGSESEMCGNGVRCVAKYAYDHGLSKNNPMKVETGRGVLTLDLKIAEDKVSSVTVRMGEPILALEEIPVDRSKLVKGIVAAEPVAPPAANAERGATGPPAAAAGRWRLADRRASPAARSRTPAPTLARAAC